MPESFGHLKKGIWMGGRGSSPQEPREATPAAPCRWIEQLSLPQVFQGLEV